MVNQCGPGAATAAPPHFSAHVYCGQTVAHLSNCWALVYLCCKYGWTAVWTSCCKTVHTCAVMFIQWLLVSLPTHVLPCMYVSCQMLWWNGNSYLCFPPTPVHFPYLLPCLYSSFFTNLPFSISWNHGTTWSKEWFGVCDEDATEVEVDAF